MVTRLHDDLIASNCYDNSRLLPQIPRLAIRAKEKQGTIAAL